MEEQAISLVGKELYEKLVKGMKWGVRRYQNPDGTLTAEGRRRYGAEDVHPSEIKRQMKKKVKTQSSDYQKTLANLQKKVNDEFDKTKEAKDAKANATKRCNLLSSQWRDSRT